MTSNEMMDVIEAMNEKFHGKTRPKKKGQMSYEE